MDITIAELDRLMAEAVAAEREACAQIAERPMQAIDTDEARMTRALAAAAIRARGKEGKVSYKDVDGRDVDGNGRAIPKLIDVATDDPKQQEALNAAREAYAGSALMEHVIERVADLLLRWDVQAERRGRIAGLREAAAQDRELADERLVTKRAVNGRLRQAFQEAALRHEQRADALEAEGKERKCL